MHEFCAIRSGTCIKKNINKVKFDVMLTFVACFPKEPPVRIVSPSQSQMELCQQTSERMVLSCEISRPNANVRWYRDGLEVEESDSLILEVDGVYRRLIIPKPTVKDSAEYVCDTAEDSVTFFVNIAGMSKTLHLIIHNLKQLSVLSIINDLISLCRATS